MTTQEELDEQYRHTHEQIIDNAPFGNVWSGGYFRRVKCIWVGSLHNGYWTFWCPETYIEIFEDA